MIILCLKEGYTKTQIVVQVRVLAAGRAALPLPRHLLLLRAAAAAQPHLRRQTQQVANHSAAAGHVTRAHLLLVRSSLVLPLVEAALGGLLGCDPQQVGSLDTFSVRSRQGDPGELQTQNRDLHLNFPIP